MTTPGLTNLIKRNKLVKYASLNDETKTDVKH